MVVDADNMGVGRSFFQREPLVEISTGHLKHFWRGRKWRNFIFPCRN